MQKDIGLVWKSGPHQLLPVCNMQDMQEVFDVLKYRIEVDEDGIRRYYNTAGQFHRTDGPAVEYADGGKLWYQNDQLHRTDGPAVERADGTKFWFHNGLRHRTAGPAIEWPRGHKEWWHNGEPLTEDEFKRAVKQNV